MIRKLIEYFLVNSRLLAILIYCFTFHTVNSMQTATPMTRSKGEIACYSCFSMNNADPSAPPFLQPSVWQNITDLVHIIEVAGMNVPSLVPRCIEAIGMTSNPNFSGAKVHVCPNSVNEPGSCVKLKGHLNGEPFVYRDCWQRMWKDPRPFHHRMSAKCFNDEMVQNFIATKENTICFCEDDLCNHSIHSIVYQPILILLLFVSIFNSYFSM